VFHVEQTPKERLSTVEWLGLGWGAFTFCTTLALGLVIAPRIIASLGEFVKAPPLFSRFVLHPAFVVGVGSVPLVTAGLAVRLGWKKSARLIVILAGAALSVLVAALLVVAMYLPLLTMADHIQP
jgi:hypothetical protein